VSKDLRSPFARAVGLGSAREGVAHWWAQRVTAIALLPLTVWFGAALISIAGSDHASIIHWLQSPLSTIGMVLLLIALFHHTALGLQVVIEDYIHSGIKLPLLIAMRLVCYALAVAGIVASLRITLGG